VFQASDVASTTAFANYVKLYQEFRVVGVQTKFLPKFINAIPGANSPAGIGVEANKATPIWMCRFHDDATAITTADEAVNHEDQKVSPVNSKMVCDTRMKETDEAQWHSTTSGTTGIFGVKVFFSGTTQGASDVVDIGTLIETFAVQFRSRVSVATAIAKSKPSAPRIDMKYDPAGREVLPVAKSLSVTPLKNNSWADESEELYVRVRAPPASAKSEPKLVSKPPDK